jgi:hypothetical protein
MSTNKGLKSPRRYGWLFPLSPLRHACDVTAVMCRWRRCRTQPLTGQHRAVLRSVDKTELPQSSSRSKSLFRFTACRGTARHYLTTGCVVRDVGFCSQYLLHKAFVEMNIGIVVLLLPGIGLRTFRWDKLLPSTRKERDGYNSIEAHKEGTSHCSSLLVTGICSYRPLYFPSVDRDSSVGTATHYWVDGPGSESRWEERYSTPVQTGSGAHPASYTMGTMSSPGVKRPGRGVDHPRHPGPRIKKE